MGIAFCPEERGIFASLDVRENLLLPPIVRSGRTVAGPDLRAVSQSQGAAQQPGHQTVGRRAADAGDRAHPAHRRALPDAGRADRGAGARHHPADRPHHRAAEEGRLHDPPGRAEFPLRRRRSPTATTSSSTARSSTVSPTPSCRPTWTSCTPISASDAAVAKAVACTKDQIDASSLRTASGGTDQRLVLRAAQSRARRDLRHAQHHQFRPWRGLHDGRVLRLFPAQRRGHRLLAGADHRADRGRHLRHDPRADHAAMAVRPRPSLRPAADLRAGADHPGRVPELFRLVRSALCDPG